jgi:Trk K+ transport system NAD-binding subunit
MLEVVGESVKILAKEPHERIDACGDALDPEVLRSSGLDSARAVILAFSDDRTTLFAVTIIRDLRPSLPIIAAVDRAENVQRIHRAGADFALSISQVTAQLLGFKLFGDHFIASEPQVRVFEARSRPLAGLTLGNARITEQTGCTVVAVERKQKTLTNLDASLTFAHDDVVYLCGAGKDYDRFFETFPMARPE